MIGSWEQLRARGARALECGRLGRSPALAKSAALAEVIWASFAAAGVRRELRLPGGRTVVGIGGATLGGAGKTPVAIALARELALRGARVSLVGHAYRARPAFARPVHPFDRVAAVGDDALFAARALRDGDVPVIVGPSRQAAVDLAAATSDVVLVDGTLQTRPQRLSLSVLIVDAAAPWGSGSCPPVGDLRAPVSDLLVAADVVGWLTDAPSCPDSSLPAGTRAIAIPSRTRFADLDGEAVPLSSLRSARVGLLLGVARPDRIERSLRAAGVAPRVTCALADHARMRAADLAPLARAGVDLWLTTGRCAVKLPRHLGPAPIATIRHELDVGDLADGVAAFAAA